MTDALLQQTVQFTPGINVSQGGVPIWFPAQLQAISEDQMDKLGPLCVALLFAATPALSGGVASAPQPTQPILAPALAPDWSGAYLGIQLETVGDGEAAGVGLAEFDGTLYGFFVGYRHDFGAIVLGGEVDYAVGGGDFTSIVPVAPTFELDYNSIFRIGAVLGYDAGRILPYATAGYASIDISLPATDAEEMGYFIGAGVDYRLSEQIVVGGEILQHEFDDFNDITGEMFSVLTLGLSIAYTF